jgi:hypothetical protein
MKIKMRKILNHKFEVIGLLFFLYLFLYGMYESDNLKNRKKISTAIITGTSYSKGSLIKYTYSVDSIDYRRRFKIGHIFTLEGMSRTNFPDSQVEKYLLYKKFPVVYDSIEIFKSELLILKKDFENYNLAFPDSLKWTNEIEN